MIFIIIGLIVLGALLRPRRYGFFGPGPHFYGRHHMGPRFGFGPRFGHGPHFGFGGPHGFGGHHGFGGPRGFGGRGPGAGGHRF